MKMAPAVEPLSEAEKQVFLYVSNNDLNGLKSHISELGLQADLYDEHGMTPLNHAAYKKQKQICRFLLDHGADVNCNRHEHGYTALHFAALSGDEELCQMLLEAGAKSRPTNSVGRTPSQMAAFVGNHNCVVVINNYIPKSEVEYFTVPHGLETEPKLKACYATPLHKLIVKVNIHPVRVALNLLPTLVEVPGPIREVLELMSAKEMRRGQETNEITAFKLHYLACVVREIMKSKSKDKPADTVELFIRKILVKKRGEEYMDLMIRDIVREFPFRECTIFRQMVTNLANAQESLPALTVVTSALNGHRGFSDEIKTCATCGEEKAAKKCSKCKEVQYCDRECQRLHWFIHKKECNRNTDDLNSKMENVKVA